MDFYKYLRYLVKQVPPGSVSTYTYLARALGEIEAKGIIKNILNTDYENSTIPWHRIIGDSGQIEGTRENQEKQKYLLEEENVNISKMVILNFKETMFHDFKTTYPLKQLRKKQISLRPLVRLEDDFTNLDIIGGVDISYRDRDAHAAYVAIDYHTHDIVSTKIICMKADFPYIPTYLAYRELPVIKHLMEKLNPSLLLVDGHGISHPYRFGFASHLGVTLDIPSIGVAKNLLCGTLSRARAGQGPVPIIEHGKKVGWALWPHCAKKPIFISPGHRVSLQTSLTIVTEMCHYRIPEPIRIAHLLVHERTKI